MKLRPYQIEIAEQGAEQLRKRGICYLAMETRTGKTLTALKIADKIGFGEVLFVTKKKAIESIKKDYNFGKFGFDLEVINFASLHKVKGNFDLFVIDEAHSIGAFPKPSQRAKRLKKLCKGKPIIFLSATPSPESYSQLYHQFYISSFSPWKKYKNFYRWADKYVEKYQIRAYGGQFVNQYDKAKKDLIEPVVKNYLITWTQKQAGFCARITEKIHKVEMNPITDIIISAIASDGIFQGKNTCVVADTPASKLNKHQQLSSGTVIADDGNRYIIDDSKARYIKDNFRGALAIFYKFKAERDLICSVFDKTTESPEEFQNGDCDVFMSQLQSGREGINLSRADHLIFLNIDHSFLSYEQTKNRFQSKDRDKPAVIHWIFNQSKLAIEPKILKAVKMKKNYTSSYYKQDFAGIRRMERSLF